MLLVALAVLAACKKSKTDAKPDGQPEQSVESPASLEPISLEINGFNYTDLYIDSFEVNGRGGGNIFVSTPESGGGGGTCCASWWPDPKDPMPLKIKWTRGGDRWCEKEVLVTGPVPANPRHLGVHFFPDGHIEAEVTEQFPEVKLRLESVSPVERKKTGNKVADEQVARCQNGYPY
ncbi:DUF3304 domain-containing protein [Archangium lipolyticum]|uniref:DUF3304 domain-containing protein n=1 Tax=Archangium lipolyticum TaxID=2970465 RepID=UPI002149F4BA|nr:DUF3304 domain-containing protein [Archangium lipolyticum]